MFSPKASPQRPLRRGPSAPAFTFFAVGVALLMASPGRADDAGVDAVFDAGVDAAVPEQKLARCKPPTKKKKPDLAALLAPDPLVQCPSPRTAWCDAAGALQQCCERGMTWS